MESESKRNIIKISEITCRTNGYLIGYLFDSHSWQWHVTELLEIENVIPHRYSLSRKDFEDIRLHQSLGQYRICSSEPDWSRRPPFDFLTLGRPWALRNPAHLLGFLKTLPVFFISALWCAVSRTSLTIAIRYVCQASTIFQNRTSLERKADPLMHWVWLCRAFDWLNAAEGLDANGVSGREVSTSDCSGHVERETDCCGSATRPFGLISLCSSSGCHRFLIYRWYQERLYKSRPTTRSPLSKASVELPVTFWSFGRIFIHFETIFHAKNTPSCFPCFPEPGSPPDAPPVSSCREQPWCILHL